MSKKYTTNFLEDTNGSTGTTNQVLVSTATGVDWVDGSGSGIIGGPYVTIGTAQTITGAKTFSSTISGSINGNAATATTLQTARTIAGVSFNGSADISLNNNAITNGAGYITSTSGTSKGTNQNYVASSTSTSNRGNYGSGVWAYSGYSTGTNRPFTYDATLQVMPDTSRGFELSVDWLSQTSTPLKIRSLRDCCQGWSDWTTVWTSTTDGSGSGLDADLLDGQQGSYYVNTGTTQTIGGAKTFSSAISAPGGNSTEWNTAYDDSITTLAFSGAGTTTLTLTQQDGGIVSNTFSNPQGTVVGATSGNTNTITVSTSNTSPIVTAVTAAVSSGSSSLATGAQIQTAINTALLGVLSYQGTWNASTNSPTLASGTGTPGYYYIVSTAGSTNLDGITDWAVGDWAVFSDLATDAWQKIDNTQVGNVTGSGANNRLAFWNGTSNLSSDDELTWDGVNLNIGTYAGTGDCELRLFGSTPNNSFSTLKTTNGNLHIDSDSGHTVYLNYYSGGSTSVIIGTGAGGSSGTTFYANGNVTVGTDLTVSGGDIILGGTGRVQGVDTVSATTDAANKAYVDAAVAGVPQGTVTGSGTVNTLPKFTGTGTSIGNSSISDTGSIVTFTNGTINFTNTGSHYWNLFGSLNLLGITDLGQDLNLGSTTARLKSIVSNAGTYQWKNLTTDLAQLSSAGALRLYNYGAGTLVSDASGNITVSSGGGAGGPYLPLTGGTLTGGLIGTTVKYNTQISSNSTMGQKAFIGISSGSGAQKFKIYKNTNTTNGYARFKIDRAFDYGNSDQMVQEAIFQRRNTTKNFVFRYDGDIVTSDDVYLEVYELSGGQVEIWLCADDYAQSVVEIISNPSTSEIFTDPSAGTPTGTLIHSSNPDTETPNWNSHQGEITATTSVTSPVFYDLSDTAFYGDFAGESRMSSIRVGGAGYGLLSSDSSRNLKFQGTGSGTNDAGITGYGSAGAHVWQLYGSGNDYGFLNSNWGSWDLRKTKGGNLYMNNQSTYYANHPGTSNLNTVTAVQFNGPLSGNASTATTFSTGRTNYKGVTDGAVAGQLMWKEYGNNHTIFDASDSTSPSGSAVNNTNPGTAWAATYPTLMGWNGSQTYGVRVDSARYADNATTASNYLPLAGGVMSGKIGRSTAITGFLEGSYNNVGANSTNTNPIYTIGSSYNPASTSLSNMYGIGYTHAGDASFVSLTGATSWGLYVAADGDARVFLDGVSGNMSCIGIVYASGGDSTEWNTAYDNRITSLTTTGTSGPATLISNVLNIPQYSGGGGGTNSWILNSDGGTPATVTVNNVQTVDFAGGANITTSISGTGNYKNLIIDLDTGGAGAGTYGSAANQTKIDTITLDAYGRVTAVTTGATGDITEITPGTGISGGGTSGTVTITNSAPNVTTNLTTSTSSTTLTVNSSDGTNAVLPAATTTAAGVMTREDKTKLDGIATGATNVTNNNQITNGAGYITQTLEVCNLLLAFKTPGAQTNYLSWVNGSYSATLEFETYKTALYAGDIDVVKVMSSVSVTGVTIVVSNAGGSIWSSGSFNLTANTVTSFSPSSAAFSANDQLYVTFTIPASASILYKVDIGLLYD